MKHTIEYHRDIIKRLEEYLKIDRENYGKILKRQEDDLIIYKKLYELCVKKGLNSFERK